MSVQTLQERERETRTTALEVARPPGFEATGVAYMNGRFVPIEEATIPIATHAFNYGTGCFEGIRGYWNETAGDLYLVKLVEHFERLIRDAGVLRMSVPLTAQELADVAVELVRRNGSREDIYIRPVVYKASPVIRVGLLGLADGFCCFTAPMGDYHNIHRGMSATVSGWRRNDDNAIPPYTKATGGYINAALAVADAQAAGYDEAILLTGDGHVSEASAANLFLVSRGGELITPDEASNILPGITRASVIGLAHERGIPVTERPVHRTELYAASELFLCGTGVQIAPITSLDGRPIGDGQIGPITLDLQAAYLAAVRGADPARLDWVTPVYRQFPAVRDVRPADGGTLDRRVPPAVNAG